MNSLYCSTNAPCSHAPSLIPPGRMDDCGLWTLAVNVLSHTDPTRFRYVRRERTILCEAWRGCSARDRGAGSVALMDEVHHATAPAPCPLCGCLVSPGLPGQGLRRLRVLRGQSRAGETRNAGESCHRHVPGHYSSLVDVCTTEPCRACKECSTRHSRARRAGMVLTQSLGVTADQTL